MTATPRPTAPPSPALGVAHRQVEAMFDTFLAASAGGVDKRTLGAMWRRFERGVLHHLDAEERWLFPHLEAKHADTIRELREAHDAIRARFEELDIAVDLHFVRHPAIAALVELLREHARVEDATLYQWAVDEVVVDDLQKMLAHVVDTPADTRVTLKG